MRVVSAEQRDEPTAGLPRDGAAAGAGVHPVLRALDAAARHRPPAPPLPRGGQHRHLRRAPQATPRSQPRAEAAAGLYFNYTAALPSTHVTYRYKYFEILRNRV